MRRTEMWKRYEKRTKKILVWAGMAVVCVGIAGCGKKADSNQKDTVDRTAKATASVVPTQFEENGEQFTPTSEFVYTTSTLNVRKDCSTDGEVVKMLAEGAKVLRIAKGENWSKIQINEGSFYVSSEYITTEKPKGKRTVIAIDAAHQKKGDKEAEAIGPNATETKAKVTSGTVGVATKLPEYELTLEVAKKLETELNERGYEVYMVRESNDVDLGTKERTENAEEAGADILIRLHANSSKVSQTKGAMTICGTQDSPYTADLYADSYRLSTEVLNGFVAKTEAENKGIWKTDVMAGINWSHIPVTIVQLGYMSNQEEDEKMATEEYQNQMAQGIADGIDAYYE